MHSMRRLAIGWGSRALGLSLTLLLTACGLWRPVTVPMRTIEEPASCGSSMVAASTPDSSAQRTTPPLSLADSTSPRSDTLLVMLPGSYALPEDFIREGFVQAVRDRHLALDMVLVDAHLGYYSDRSIIDRLRADVIAPARARGYRHIWLMGISIGAFGAMILAETLPQDFDGVIALGPYLGKRAMSEEINAQGGLRSWRAPQGTLDREEIDAILWRWLQRNALLLQQAGQQRPSAHPQVLLSLPSGEHLPPAGVKSLRPLPPGEGGGEGAQRSGLPQIYLGYGLDDRFKFSDGLLAAALPADHVFTTEGGHDWGPWLVLWKRALDSTVLAARCPSP
jgi:pimeloyl-ACP methyl ester carboxylesterase